MAKNNFGTNFGPFGQKLPPPLPQFFVWILPLLDVRHCCKLSRYAVSKKTNEPHLRKWPKTSFWDWFRPVGLKFGQRVYFFFKYLVSSDTRNYGQLSCTISEKTNDPILRKLSDGRTGGRTNQSDFIARFPTNIERPKQVFRKENHFITV